MADHVDDSFSNISSDGGSTSDRELRESNGQDGDKSKKLTKKRNRLLPASGSFSDSRKFVDLAKIERRLGVYDVYDSYSDSFDSWDSFDSIHSFGSYGRFGSFDSSGSSDDYIRDNFRDRVFKAISDVSKQERPVKRDCVVHDALEVIAESDSEGKESRGDEVLDGFQEKVKRLKFLRARIDWNVKESRHEIYRLLDHSITDWQGRLPTLRDIFEDEEIERLVFDHRHEADRVPAKKFIDFLISTGYKDEPKLDEDGKPLLGRSTPIHLAARLGYHRAVAKLFRIYDRHDANYSDEAGVTHFRLACASGCRDVVEKFLRLGRVDANAAGGPAKNGGASSPLYLALANRRDEVAKLLLRHGANPNAANENGTTPLHVISRRYLEDDFVEPFFRICDKRRKRVRIDARNKRGRTPLQLAVANLQSRTVDLLLDRGADLSRFVFPTEDYFAEGFVKHDFALRSVSRALAIVASLEKRGYELKPRDARTIIKFFHRHGLFRGQVKLDAYLLRHERFVAEAKKSTFARRLSLHDLLGLPLDRAKKVLEAADRSRFDDSTEDWQKLLRGHEPCTLYLCEIMSSEFVRRWFREFYRYVILNKK